MPAHIAHLLLLPVVFFTAPSTDSGKHGTITGKAAFADHAQESLALSVR